jgi:hypothetical protein
VKGRLHTKAWHPCRISGKQASLPSTCMYNSLQGTIPSGVQDQTLHRILCESNCLILFIFDWRSSGLFKSFNSITLILVLRSLNGCQFNMSRNVFSCFFTSLTWQTCLSKRGAKVQLLFNLASVFWVFWKLRFSSRLFARMLRTYRCCGCKVTPYTLLALIFFDFLNLVLTDWNRF